MRLFRERVVVAVAVVIGVREAYSCRYTNASACLARALFSLHSSAARERESHVSGLVVIEPGLCD